jgi:hypothetical protein
VDVIGVSANARDEESAYGLAPFQSVMLVGDQGSGADLDVPGPVSFGVAATGRGELEISGIGFDTLENTRTIESVSVVLTSIDEVAAGPAISLQLPVDATCTNVSLAGADSLTPGDHLLIGEEALQVIDNLGSGDLVLKRGALASTASPHGGAAIARLLTRSFHSFPVNGRFLGTPASENLRFRVPYTNRRLVAAEMYATNKLGDSPTGVACFTFLEGNGLRSPAGGQYTLQVAGFLARQYGATPPLVVESTHSVQALEATVSTAPASGALRVLVRRNGLPYAELLIPDGAGRSAALDVMDLPALVSGDTLVADVLEVPSAAASMPGKDLTITIAL